MKKKILKSLIFALFIILFLLSPPKASAQNQYFCAVYFTYIGCPNCAVCDPIVLTEWPKKYPNLVVIEYMWDMTKPGGWQDPNSQFFGVFAQEYKTPAAVPKIVFKKSNIQTGGINVPKAEKYIKEFNPCPLIDKSISFEKLNLSELKAKPKIWANQRILISLGNNEWLFQWNGEKINPKIIGEKKIDNKLLKDLLFTDDISELLEGRKFEIVEPQRADFSAVAFKPNELLAIIQRIYPADFLSEYYKYVPFAEFENAIKINISEEVISEKPIEEQPIEEQPAGEQPTEEEIELPIIGKIKTEEFSLPVLTLLLGLADGFNPCAFFVLTFLLAALIGLAGARKKILLVGGIFIFFTALFYLLFMAVLLNVLQLGKGITFITIIAGLIADFAGIINIKDYFAFQKGISLTLPKGQREKFIEKVKNLSLVKSTLTLAIGTAIIAATVNIYELLCTFGFPMIYTRILTLRELSSLQYYLYLVFYNLIYVIPLSIIVLIFAITLGRKTFSEIWVRRLKLISGFMILFLGSILITKPKLLESISAAFSVLILAVLISTFIILVETFIKRKSDKIKIL